MIILQPCEGHTFAIDKRYTPETVLGRGSFGVVCKAFDTQEKLSIAIKRIRPFATDEWDAKHALREIKLLKILRGHPNIITLLCLSVFAEKEELYMFMEAMDCDLHRIIQSKQALSDSHVKCFALQLLEGMKAMHSVGIFHRDLKPSNILINKDCLLKITDFGLSRCIDEPNSTESKTPMTEYVVTRWYRCPELLLAPKHKYSSAVDIWAGGCIIAELMRRKPIFPGKSHTHQVQLVFELLGYSSPSDFGFSIRFLINVNS